MIDGKQNEIPGVYIDETPKLVKIYGGNPNQVELLPLNIIENTTIQELVKTLTGEEDDLEPSSSLVDPELDIQKEDIKDGDVVKEPEEEVPKSQD